MNVSRITICLGLLLLIQACEYEEIPVADSNPDLVLDIESIASGYFKKAMDYAAMGDKHSARKYAQWSLITYPTNKEPFNFIGDLYMGSFDDCKKGNLRTEDYAIFIAAYNNYRAAGNQEGMKNAEKLFPTMETMFNEEYEEGDVIMIDCWIKTTVVLKRRPITTR